MVVGVVVVDDGLPLGEAGVHGEDEGWGEAGVFDEVDAAAGLGDVVVEAGEEVGLGRAGGEGHVDGEGEAGDGEGEMAGVGGAEAFEDGEKAAVAGGGECMEDVVEDGFGDGDGDGELVLEEALAAVDAVPVGDAIEGEEVGADVGEEGAGVAALGGEEAALKRRQRVGPVARRAERRAG